MIATLHSMSDVWDAYRGELDGVEDRVRKNLDSSVTLVNTVAAHILSGGGKRVRPLLLLLSARLCGYPGTNTISSAVSSNSSIPRRCFMTMSWMTPISGEADEPHARYGETKSASSSVTTSYESHVQSREVPESGESMKCSPKPVRRWPEGEVLQLYYNGNPSMPEIDDIKIFEYKTGRLDCCGLPYGGYSG